MYSQGSDAEENSKSTRPPLEIARITLRFFALLAAALILGGCTPEDSLETARSQQAAGNLRGSLETLRTLVAADPSNTEANLLLGIALFRNGESGSAIWPLRIAVRDPNLAVEAGLALTEAALQSRFKDQAIQAANAVLAIEPENVAALEMRIDAYQAASRNEEVLEEVAGILALDPGNKKILVPRIVAYLALEKEEEAAEALKMAKEGLAKVPDEGKPEPAIESARARLCVVSGMFSFERGDPEAADVQYAKCLEDHPGHPLVVQGAVTYYDQTRRNERATEILEEALAQESTSQFRTLLAQRMKRFGKAEEAERLLREEAEQNPSPNAWFVLGDHYVRQDMLDEAVVAFGKAVNAAPEPPPMIVFAHADTLIQANQLDEARQAGAKLEGTPLGDLIEGRILAAEGKWEEALATFEKGIQLWPNNPGARFLAGETAEKLGRFNEAISHYREAIRADKTQADSALNLALLQEAEGLDVQALDRIGHYVRANPQDPKGYEISIRLANRVGQREILRQGLSRLAQLPNSRGLALSLSAEMVRRQKGTKESIELIQRSPLDLTDPENADALGILVRGLLRMEQSEEAQKYVQAALEAHPECADFHALHGRVLHHLDSDGDKKAKAYRRAVELDADHVIALMALANLEAEAQRSDQALEFYDRASQADLTKPAAAVAALQLLREQASLEERQAHAETYLLRHLHSPALASELAQIVAQRGTDPERALELARRAARFDRGPRKATREAFQAIADAGIQPQADTAQSVLDQLKPQDP